MHVCIYVCMRTRNLHRSVQVSGVVQQHTFVLLNVFQVVRTILLVQGVHKPTYIHTLITYSVAQEYNTQYQPVRIVLYAYVTSMYVCMYAF